MRRVFPQIQLAKMDAMDPDKLRLYGVQMVEYVARYWEQLDGVMPLSSVSARSIVDQLPENAPTHPEEWYSIIRDVENIIMPGITHWQSPNFHGYFPAANSYPSICADILLDGIGFSCMPSPACKELEIVMMNWLGRMLQLPEEFLNTEGSTGGGMIQGSSSESLHFIMLVARDRALKRAKRDEEEASNIIDVVNVDREPDGTENMASMHNEITSYCCNEDVLTSTIKFTAETKITHPRIPDASKDQKTCVHDRLITYASEEAHCSIEKACLLTSVICRKLPTDQEYSLRGEALEKAIQEDRDAGNIPFMVIVIQGTASCVSFDNLVEIGEIAHRERLWLHVDAAYAGASFICPEFRHLMKGLEMADSFNFNPHNWLQVNFDCSALWLRNMEALEEASESLEKSTTSEEDIPDSLIAPGRRFRSLKLWFVLRMFGTSVMRQQILKQVGLAKGFMELLQGDGRFELVGPNSLGIVCFRLKGSNEDNLKLYEKINGDGKIFITKALTKASEPPGLLVLRFAICSPLTELVHVELGWTEVKRHADALSDLKD